MDRREALRLFGALPASLAMPSWAHEALPRANDFWIRPRHLRLAHPSGDRIQVVYWSDGEVIRPAWEEVSWFLRDRVDQKAVYMNPVLLDILYGVCGWLDFYGIRDPLTTTSGYRTPGRSVRLEGAAQNGEHPKGGASDITHPSVSADRMARFGKWLGGGGVGWYPQRNFVHVDRGRLRQWRG
jgi:uncharacterized protein YcbK (DUF882 family)